MLFLAAEAHHVFHARTVVPTAIENDDLTSGRKMLHVALHVHLSLLAIRWRGKRDHSEYALADALTICDGYHCSMMGPTWPNRLYLMTGQVDPAGEHGGPIYSNEVPSSGYSWETYPEMLTNGGVSWQIYQEIDNYGFNVMEYFDQYQNAAVSSPLYQGAMRIFQALLDLGYVTPDELKVITGKRMKANPDAKNARNRGAKSSKGAKARQTLAALSNVTLAGQAMGTPAYMAPEQAAGEAVDHRADLFSLGSVLYSLCAGRPPFRATGTLAILKRVSEDAPRPIKELNPDIEARLSDILLKSISREPTERYATATAFKESLLRLERQDY